MRVLVTGAQGQVGTEVVAELIARNADRTPQSVIEIIGASHAQLDVGSRDQVHGLVRTLEPDVIIHPAAFTAVDACESEVDRAFRVNALGTRYLAEAANAVGAHLCYLSTDYVFDGTLDRPYREWDTTNPQSVYGRSKLAGEQSVDSSSTIVRTSWVCGRIGQNMVKTVLRLMDQNSDALRFVDDQHGCPTIASDLATAVVELALSRRRGIFHVTNQGATTWYEFAQSIVAFAGGDQERVVPIATADLNPPRPAKRPANSVLENGALAQSGISLLPDWHESTARLVRDLRL